MTYYVYKITNLINGKIYIGKAANVQKRWSQHKTAANTQDPNDYTYLHRAMNKHGFDNFTIETLSEHDAEQEALDEEIRLISLRNARDRKIGYNLTNGGDGASGYKHTEEAKKRMSDQRKTAYIGEDNPFFGKTHSKTTKATISQMATENHQLGKYIASDTQQCAFNTQQCLEIQDEYRTTQYSFEELAEMHNTNLNTIHGIIHGIYFAIRGKSSLTEDEIADIMSQRKEVQSANARLFTAEQEQQIIVQYQKGKSARELSSQYPCSSVSILNILKRNGTPIRKRWDPIPS